MNTRILKRTDRPNRMVPAVSVRLPTHQALLIDLETAVSIKLFELKAEHILSGPVHIVLGQGHIRDALTAQLNRIYNP